MSNYHLDVTFSSDVNPADDTMPVALAYGYADDTEGKLNGTGQRKEIVHPNASVVFDVFDTVPSAASNVASVELTVKNKDPNSPYVSPFKSDPGSQYLSWPKGENQFTVNNDNGLKFVGTDQKSFGCNIKGSEWSVGPFLVDEIQGESQEFEISVLVKLQNNKTYMVDPEMVVKGGN